MESSKPLTPGSRLPVPRREGLEVRAVSSSILKRLGSAWYATHP